VFLSSTTTETSLSTCLTRSDRRKRKDKTKAQKLAFTITTTPDRRSSKEQGSSSHTHTKHKHQHTPIFASSHPANNGSKAAVLLGAGGPTVRVARKLGASIAAGASASKPNESLVSVGTFVWVTS
jgi:hypothetical protein